MHFNRILPEIAIERFSSVNTDLSSGFPANRTGGCTVPPNHSPSMICESRPVSATCFTWPVLFRRVRTAIGILGLAAGLDFIPGRSAHSADRTPAPLDPAEAARQAILPAGFRMTVFAAEPQVVQPVSFCIDDRGRLFVAEALNYGEWKPTGNDRIVVLSDIDGDGKADARTIFYEGFNYITGVEVGFGGVWVVSPPNLYFVPDRDGDLKPDGEPQIVFDGFGYKESRHNLVNGFTWGPDGWLYGGHGRTSPSDVGPPGTPQEQRIHCDGGVFRIHPTRRVFENFADGTTNPWGVDFDEFGECFVSNCVNPHLFHVIPGAHYEPWRNRPSSQYAYDRLPTIADHLHYPTGKPNEMRGETAEVLALGGGHAHCGTLVYLGDRFPESFRNGVLMCNVHGRRINHDQLRRHGSGYTASHNRDFMISADPWFMGVTLRTGPDGNVFVSDWSDTGECHTYKPETATGRIYKICYGNEPSPPVNLSALSDEQLVELQWHRNEWYVAHARRLLHERASKSDGDHGAVHTALLAVLDSPREPVSKRLRALWTLRVTLGLTNDRLLRLLGDPEEQLRSWTVRLICEGSRPSPEALARMRELARDEKSPVVRLSLAAALQRIPLESRWDIARNLVSHPEDASDANLPLMFWYGIEPLVPADLVRALELASSAQVPLVREFIARRAADHVLSRKGAGDFEPLVVALRNASEEAARDLLKGMRDSIRGQRGLRLPEAWSAVYTKLAQDEDRATRRRVVELALSFGDAQAVRDLVRAAGDQAIPNSERIEAVESLVDAQIPNLAATLQELLTDPDVRRAAIRGLATVPDARTPGKLLALYTELNREERQEVIATLASRPDFARHLLDSLENQSIPRSDVSAYTARQIVALSDKRLTERLGKVWGTVRGADPAKKETVARYTKLLTTTFLSGADVENGGRVFGKLCGNCHKLRGEGGAIGPDLTGTNRSDLEYLLSNLVDPSAEVSQDYRMSLVETRNGLVLTGIVLEKSAIRIVLQTDAKQVVIA